MNHTNQSLVRTGCIAVLCLGAVLCLSAADNTANSQPPQSQPVVRREVTPVYPYDLLLSGKAGWVDANLVVDYSGRPLLASPQSASDPALLKAALAIIEATEYQPAKKNKHTVMTAVMQRVVFPGEAEMDASARRILGELRKNKPGFCSLMELDQRPKTMKQVVPVYPRAMKEDGLTGQAEIEFVVDREGRVHFPRVVSASQEGFGWAAAIAVAQWRYEPPTRNGQSVDVRMVVPVLFDARSLAAAD
jgi:TonB family protein